MRSPFLFHAFCFRPTSGTARSLDETLNWLQGRDQYGFAPPGTIGTEPPQVVLHRLRWAQFEGVTALRHEGFAVAGLRA